MPQSSSKAAAAAATAASRQPSFPASSSHLNSCIASQTCVSLWKTCRSSFKSPAFSPDFNEGNLTSRSLTRSRSCVLLYKCDSASSRLWRRFRRLKSNCETHIRQSCEHKSKQFLLPFTCRLLDDCIRDVDGTRDEDAKGAASCQQQQQRLRLRAASRVKASRLATLELESLFPSFPVVVRSALFTR